MAENQIKTGLIGFGLSGRVFHAPFIDLCEDFELNTVVQRSGGSAKTIYPSIRVVDSHDKILADKEIELVVVSTPNSFHFDMAKQALLHGKHVIIEKPFATTLIETEELIQLAEKKKRHLFVFHNRRWDGDFLTVKKVVQEGLLGDVVSYEAHYDRYKPALGTKPWKEDNLAGSGILYDLGTHIIDQAVCLFGKPNRVAAQLSQQREGSAIDDSFDLRLAYDGLMVTLKSTLFAREIGPRYIIHGRKGSFVKFGIDPQEDDMKAGLSPLSDGWGAEAPENWGVLNATVNGLNFRGTVQSFKGNYMQFYENVYDVIRNNGSYAIPPREAQITTAIIGCALESHNSGEVVTCR